jgi:hypothetical protein
MQAELFLLFKKEQETAYCYKWDKKKNKSF